MDQHPNRFLRSSPYFARGVLLFAALLMMAIALRTLTDPVGAAARDHISLGSAFAVTVASAGFGGFPLAMAIFVGLTIFSSRLLVPGLVFLAVLMPTLLIVRVLAILSHGALAENAGPLIGETVFSVLAVLGLLWEVARLRQGDARSSPQAGA